MTWWENCPLKRIPKTKYPPAEVYPNQLNRPKRVEKLHRLKSQPIFLKLPKRNGANHLIFQPDFCFPMQMSSTLRFPLNSKMIQQMRYWFDCPKKSTEIFGLHLLAMTLRGFSIKYTMVLILASQSNAARWRSRWRRTYIFSSFSKENQWKSHENIDSLKVKVNYLPTAQDCCPFDPL